MPLLSFKNIAIGYDNSPILENLSFSIEQGDYLAILGENGAGKSTLLKTMLGLIKQLSGEIIFDTGVKRADIGYLPQQTVVQRDFPASVWEIVISGCLGKNGLKPFYSKEDKMLAESNIKKLGLEDLKKSCYRELSGGQQQRVLLARALCSSDKLLVLDEPVTGLDPKVTIQLYSLIDSLNKEGITIIMISHDLEALKHANKILHLGHETFFGNKEEYLKSPLYQVFMDKGGKKTMIELFDTIASYFQFQFVQYAFIVGILIALCSSLLGVTLVLKRFSFIGDGLSHMAFGAMAVAAVVGLTNNMIISMPVTIVAAILLLRTSQNSRIKGDAAVAMLSVGALAIGYLLMNIFPTSSNVSADVCTTLFGSVSILTLSTVEVWICIGLSILTGLIFIFFYHKIFAVTFDENFARATGVKANLYNLLIAIVTAIIIVLAMNLVGSLLISALIIFPSLSAMRVFKSFKSVTISSAVISVLCAASGLLISIVAGTPVGPTIVAVDIVVFFIFFLTGFIISRVRKGQI